METRAHYVAVGAFVLALVFLGFVAVLWIGGTQFTSNNASYDIFFKGAVTGLSKGAPVDYNGIPVGRVADIEIDPNNVEQIRVTVEIKKEVVIKENAAANVESNILSGVSYILITRGTQDAKPLEARKGERYPVIRARRSTLASLSARGPQLMEKVETILDHLDDVLSDDNRKAFSGTLANVQKFSGTLSEHSNDFAQVASDASDALKSITGFVNGVGKSYADPDGLKDRLRAGLAEFTNALAEFDKVAKSVNVVVQDARPGVRTFSQHTLSDIDALVGEARQLVSGLSRFAGQLERDPTRLLFGDRREGVHPK